MSNGDNSQPVFQVDAYSDPAILRIVGRASYLNCGPIGEFFRHMAKEGKQDVVVDFAKCTGMDSTFLGILAGAALEFRKQEPPTQLHLVRMGTRNLELVRNLGLHRILDVDNGDFEMAFADKKMEAAQESAADAQAILHAHESLVAADQGNRQKFQDVLSYLKIQTGEEDLIE